VKFYTQALGLGNLAPLDEATLLSNRSAAYLRSPMVSGPSNALKDGQKCCQLRPSWYKGFTRVGDAYYAMKKFVPEAKEAYENALAVCTEGGDKVRELRENVRLCEGANVAAPSSTDPTRPPATSTSSKSSEEREWKFENVEEVREKLATDDNYYANRTARKHFAASVDDADRVSAQRLKEDMLESYRKKAKEKQLDPTEAAFEKYNIRSYAHLDKTSLPEDFSKGTDYIGKAITNEALKGTTGGSWGDDLKGIKMKPKTT